MYIYIYIIYNYTSTNGILLLMSSSNSMLFLQLWQDKAFLFPRFEIQKGTLWRADV